MLLTDSFLFAVKKTVQLGFE